MMQPTATPSEAAVIAPPICLVSPQARIGSGDTQYLTNTWLRLNKSSVTNQNRDRILMSQYIIFTRMRMAISLCDERLREIVDKIAVELGYSRLKTEQMQAILEFLQG